jgi:hypothetical protein
MPLDAILGRKKQKKQMSGGKSKNDVNSYEGRKKVFNFGKSTVAR